MATQLICKLVRVRKELAGKTGDWLAALADFRNWLIREAAQIAIVSPLISPDVLVVALGTSSGAGGTKSAHEVWNSPGLLAQAQARGLSLEAYLEQVLRERSRAVDVVRLGPSEKAKAFRAWAANHP